MGVEMHCNKCSHFVERVAWRPNEVCNLFSQNVLDITWPTLFPGSRARFAFFTAHPRHCILALSLLASLLLQVSRSVRSVRLVSRRRFERRFVIERKLRVQPVILVLQILALSVRCIFRKRQKPKCRSVYSGVSQACMVMLRSISIGVKCKSCSSLLSQGAHDC